MTDDRSEELLELLANDLDGGFTELVRIHAGAVYTFLYRVTGSTTDVDDLGQDTFLRAYAALRSYDAERRRNLQPRPWLITIAANVWRNHVRSRVRRPVSAVSVEDAYEWWPDTSPGPEEHAATAEDRRLLVAALLKLPEKHQIPVVLRHVVGMSYAEVAQVQGCPVGTVKAQVSRGLEQLRVILTAQRTDPREVTK